MSEKRPVTNTYHGVEVVDNYQWLEDQDDSGVVAWTEAHNRHARAFLSGIDFRDQIEQRLKALYAESSAKYYSFHYQDGTLLAMKNDPSLDQPVLVGLTALDDLSTERVIVDPNTLDPKGRTAIDFFVVSPDAQLVAVSLSKNGTEDGDVHVFNIETGEALTDVVQGVNGPTAGGDVAWTSDGSGFYYSRYPREGERPADSMRFYQQVYYHSLGTPSEEDRYEIGEQFPAIAEIEFVTSPDNRYVIAQVANGDGGEYAHYVKREGKDWQQLTRHSDLIPKVKFGPGGDLYFLSHKESPRGKLLKLPAGRFDLGAAKIAVAEAETVLEDFIPTDSRLFMSVVDGGPSRIIILNPEEQLQKEVPIPPISSVRDLTSLGGDRVLFRRESYTEPSGVYVYDAAEGALVETPLRMSSPADFSEVEVVRDFAVSKDGTRVPMNIIRRKGTLLTGDNPTVLYGYGGYGSIQRPYYDRDLSLWLDNGGVYVKANIRGGGEFGEEWHLAGNLTKKQNVFDDFAACARYLIDLGYTNPSKLAIRGGSNGGLLMGAVMTQHPELFKAVVCQRGVLDMLRVELDPNGAFNVTEFGTVTDPDHFKAMYAYSPYHNVEDGVKYPDLLLTADEDDGRVLSYHSKKLAAAVDAAHPENLVLLRTTSGRGHGLGSSLTDDIALAVDIYSFLLDRLNVKLSADWADQ